MQRYIYQQVSLKNKKRFLKKMQTPKMNWQIQVSMYSVILSFFLHSLFLTSTHQQVPATMYFSKRPLLQIQKLQILQVKMVHTLKHACMRRSVHQVTICTSCNFPFKRTLFTILLGFFFQFFSFCFLCIVITCKRSMVAIGKCRWN